MNRTDVTQEGSVWWKFVKKMAVRICCMYRMDNCYDGLSRCSEGLLNVPTWRCNLNALEGEYDGQSDVGRGVDLRHYIAQDERARV
jgi:hypothetical protein